MSKNIIPEVSQSRVTYDVLVGAVRQKVQKYIQDILEEELTEFPGRHKSKRSSEVDGFRGYRNGHGKPRRLAFMSGTITVRRPRLRGIEERFISDMLPFFKRRIKEVGNLLPELYLHGLDKGDFDIALRGLLDDGAPLSPASIDRLKAKWQAEYEEWKKQDLSALKVVYQWAYGVYVKAGLEKDKAALLVTSERLRAATRSF